MKKIPLIIDCDTGHDDAMALLIALASDKIDLKGITCVAGNNTVINTTNNTLKILELTKRTEIPVAMGRHNPFFKEIMVAEDVHGVSGMDGPVLPEPVTKPIELSAVEFIAKVLKESEEKVVIAAVGPYTNIATFILCYPELLHKIEKFTLMGGGYCEGNRTSTSEFNVWQDPEAAHIVFNSGVPIDLFGLDVTHKNHVRMDEYMMFKNNLGVVHQVVSDLLDFFAKAYVEVRKFPGPPIHDSCAIANLIDPSIYTGVPAHIDVMLEGSATRGACLIDLRPEGRRFENNATVYFDSKRLIFLELLLSSCRKLEEEIKLKGEA